MRPHHLPGLMLALLLPALAPCQAASTGRLPAWLCGQGQPPLFIDGFEAGGAIHQEPSGGSGGAYPGAVSRTVVVEGISHSYHLHVPVGYPYSDPVPVLLALHGAAGPGSAPAAAQAVRDVWAATANTGQFIVAAPVATGSSGGWVPGTDYGVMQAVLNDIAAHYDIDASRIHGWGFSAGGHVLHDLALRQRDGAPDIHDLAAYAVSAGALQGYACTSSVDCAALLTQVARRIPVDLRVGGSDPLLPYLQADHARFQAAGWGADAALSVFPAGHVVVPSQLQPTWDFLCRFQRLPD